MRRSSETSIKGRYGTLRVESKPGAGQSATGLSLLALPESVHSDGAIPPGRKYFLLMSHSSLMLVLRARIQFGSTSVLAALPHLRKVVNLGHSVQYSSSPSLFISFSFSEFILSNAGSVPAKISLLAGANCITTNFLRSVSPVVIDCLQPILSQPRQKLASTPTPCGMIENMSRAPLKRLVYL